MGVSAEQAATRSRSSMQLFISLSIAIWFSKIYALYRSHDVWSEHSGVYVALVGAVSSYREILLAAGLSVSYYLSGRLLARWPTARALSDVLVIAGSTLVVLVNYVNAQLVPTLGSPLTLPLIHYSNVFATQHGRDALWAWTDRSFILLGTGLAIAVAGAWLAGKVALQRLGQRLVLTLLITGTFLVGVGGITRSPAPANLTESGTRTLVESIVYPGIDAWTPHIPVERPFSLGGVEPGLPLLEGPAAKPSNVILIVLEAAAAQYLDTYGGTYNITPHLTAQAERSVIVRNAYAQIASSTAALRVLLSSRYPYPSMLAAADVETAGQSPRLPRILADAGLRTALFHSSDTRFDRAGEFLASSGFVAARDYRDRKCGDGVLHDRYGSLGNSDRCTFADMLAWIEQQHDKRFFAMLWTFQSHYPYFAGARRQPKVDSASIPTHRARADKQRYLAALSEADDLIGGLLRHLQRTGRADETLIIVTGDHGQAFGQHGTFGNGTSVYEETVRVPLILIHPRLARTGTFHRLTGHIDVAPTILDILGLDVPDEWEGVSLFRATRERPIYFVNNSADLVLGYRLGNKKVIANFVRGTTEIYDLAADPAERSDLAKVQDERAVQMEQAWLATWAGQLNRRWRSDSRPSSDRAR